MVGVKMRRLVGEVGPRPEIQVRVIPKAEESEVEKQMVGVVGNGEVVVVVGVVGGVRGGIVGGGELNRVTNFNGEVLCWEKAWIKTNI